MNAFLKSVILWVCLCACDSQVNAQSTRYTIQLKNKDNTSYTLANPGAYLSPRAIARRTRYSIAIDSFDMPVSPSYLNQIRAVSNVTILNVSKWLNQICIRTTDPAAITTINGFSFVQNTSPIAARTMINTRVEPATFPFEARPMEVEADYFDYGTNSYNEIHLHNGEFLHNIGLRGQNMQIAMLDAGFLNYTSLRSFDSVNANGQVLGTWDFVDNNASVVEDYVHGMECFSTIAANIPGQFIGKAPKASFYLYRTENVSGEYPIEEFNWVCAAERADSTGADIISSSLGYYSFDNAAFDYTYANMNGRTTIASKGAIAAARKGLLVFNSAGNEGTNGWHYIATPADADSILAIGAVNTSGAVWPSSSYGPSADGRIKPDVSSIGWLAVKQNAGNTIGLSNGTSYAAPNMAGLGTCLWQGFPEFNNMRILRAIRQSGSIATAPNDRIGYGIPNMKKAFADLLQQYATGSASISNCVVTLNWNSKDVRAMKYEVERKLANEGFYVKVGELNPQAGDILAAHSYTFTNTLTNVAAGSMNFRIRQIIDTSAAGLFDVYIDTMQVNLVNSCAPPPPTATTLSLQVAPNPSAANTPTKLVVETPNAISQVNVSVIDMKGRMMAELQFAAGAGRTIVDLPVERIAAGEYLLQVFDNKNKIGTLKWIKLR